MPGCMMLCTPTGFYLLKKLDLIKCHLINVTTDIYKRVIITVLTDEANQENWSTLQNILWTVASTVLNTFCPNENAKENNCRAVMSMPNQQGAIYP